MGVVRMRQKGVVRKKKGAVRKKGVVRSSRW